MEALDVRPMTNPALHDRPSVQRPGRLPFILSAALGVAAAAASGLTVAFPSLLTGVAGSNRQRAKAATVIPPLEPAG